MMQNDRDIFDLYYCIGNWKLDFAEFWADDPLSIDYYKILEISNLIGWISIRDFEIMDDLMHAINLRIDLNPFISKIYTTYDSNIIVDICKKYEINGENNNIDSFYRIYKTFNHAVMNGSCLLSLPD